VINSISKLQPDLPSLINNI